jgi:CBS domain-containing protein
MRLNPPTASATDNIAAVITMMVKENIGAVIALEAERPIGIITEKDILDRVLNAGKDIERTLVGDVMSKPLLSIEANRPMREALKLMRDSDIRRLAVTQDGSLVGVITERRLLEVAFLVT